jgi:kynurenine formamidase
MDLSENTKQQIQEDVQNAFGTVLEFEKFYGDTVRKSGDILNAGEPRDTIDEGDLVGSLDILTTNKGVTLRWDDEAYFVLEDRPELVEEIINSLDIKAIAIDYIKFYLSGQKL